MKMGLRHFGIAFLSLLSTYYSQDESKIINLLFSPSGEITQLTEDLISIGVDAVWFASEVTGVGTITGTITQSSLNTEQWNYSSSPNDKLIINWANGDRLEYVFNQIEGYTDGDAEDFKDSHYMDFYVLRTGQINLQIVSSAWPDEGILKWQRNIKGDVLYENEIMNININNNGQYYGEIGGGIGIYRYWEEALGQANSNSLSLTISEAHWRTMTHNSNNAVFVLNKEIRNNSSVLINDITYQFQNAHVFWAAYTEFADSASAGIYNKVIDAHQWESEGILLKNNQVYGNVQFSSPPINYTYGPVLICKLNNGSEILLHSLINPFVTDVANVKVIPKEYILSQNYPNPFNPSTKIKYSIPLEVKSEKLAQTLAGGKVKMVTLTIYDILGREIVTLVNEEQGPGNYEVEFNPSAEGVELSSGTYFYRLQVQPVNGRTGSYVETKKMLMIK